MFFGMLSYDLTVMVVHMLRCASAFTICVSSIFLEPILGNLKPESNLQGIDLSICRRPITNSRHLPPKVFAHASTLRSSFNALDAHTCFASCHAPSTNRVNPIRNSVHWGSDQFKSNSRVDSDEQASRPARYQSVQNQVQIGSPSYSQTSPAVLAVPQAFSLVYGTRFGSAKQASRPTLKLVQF